VIKIHGIPRIKDSPTIIDVDGVVDVVIDV
jgi:hypothetical protein